MLPPLTLPLTLYILLPKKSQAEPSVILPTIIPQDRLAALTKIHFHFESLVTLDIVLMLSHP